MSFIYLASPYTHKNRETVIWRYERVLREAAKMMEQGHTVFCPIGHSHPIEQMMTKRQGHDFWMKQDIAILRHAESLAVLMLDGWEKSKGMAQEIDFARQAGIPITYIGDSEAVGVAHSQRDFAFIEAGAAKTSYGGSDCE